MAHEFKPGDPVLLRRREGEILSTVKRIKGIRPNLSCQLLELENGYTVESDSPGIYLPVFDSRTASASSETEEAN